VLPTPPSRVAVVIPSYRVSRHVLGVIAGIGPDVERIYVVDDRCPEDSGGIVESTCTDPRVRVIRHRENGGVGAAVVTGYRAAIDEGLDIVVKVDGDGQMDPSLIPQFIAPIARGEVDYTKGNRFWDLTHIQRMPWVRRFGNLGLSFLAKASTGYWDLFDPTNGYTALSVPVAARLPLDGLSRRYFFETDVLFRLNTLRAAVADVPMDARYGDESSSLSVRRVLFEFAFKHARNLGKRIFYNYFLRDLSIASLELLAAVTLLAFALVFGGLHWWHSIQTGVSASVGTVMIAALSAISGLQFLLAFLGYDIAAVPKRAVHPLLPTRGLASSVKD